MLKTKMAKATVGGLSPTKEYTLQIYILNGSQEALFVKRKFVIEELKNQSQARSHRKHPTSMPEKGGILTVEATSPTLDVTSTLIGKVEPGKKRQNTPLLKPDDYMLNAEPTLTLSTLPSVIEFEEDFLARRKTSSDSFRKGLSQYSSDPRTEWDLNTYSTWEQVSEAIRNLRYKGGNTFTALTHVLEQNLKEEAGARPEASKLLILLTDGKSQDDASPPAQILKNMGIKIFAVELVSSGYSMPREGRNCAFVDCV
ncbi:hypothetical protein Chor_004227 [Crotalus horridus]